MIVCLAGMSACPCGALASRNRVIAADIRAATLLWTTGWIR